MTTVTTTNARHVLFRLDPGARLPEALVAKLRDEVVIAGWVRATATLEDVELRIGSGSPRKITGILHAISIEGSVGLANGDVSCNLRAVLTRETETGLETLAGEIVGARVKAGDGIAIALDDVTAGRDAGFFTSLSVAAPSSPALPAAAPPPPPVAAPAPAPPPPPVVAAPAPAPPPPPAPVPSAPPPPVAPPSDPEVAKPKPSPTFMQSAMPARIVKPQVEEEEQAVPDAGDVVEHFAFGRCEVVKSDGDRLHIRLGKDGRIKEVALEMLKVTPLPPVEGATGKHFRLDRKL